MPKIGVELKEDDLNKVSGGANPNYTTKTEIDKIPDFDGHCPDHGLCLHFITDTSDADGNPFSLYECRSCHKEWRRYWYGDFWTTH